MEPSIPTWTLSEIFGTWTRQNIQSCEDGTLFTVFLYTVWVAVSCAQVCYSYPILNNFMN